MPMKVSGEQTSLTTRDGTWITGDQQTLCLDFHLLALINSKMYSTRLTELSGNILSLTLKGMHGDICRSQYFLHKTLVTSLYLTFMF